MARLPVIPRQAGLRRLAVGGVAVTSAYDQICHYLGSQLGKEYAGLFAEPVESGNQTDWYCDLPGQPQRLVEMTEPQRSTYSGRLANFVAALDSNIEALMASRGDYHRHLGQLLKFAIQIPDDRDVWVVGDQLVLTYWGHTSEVGEPARSPIYSLISRLSDPAAPEPQLDYGRDDHHAANQTRHYLPAPDQRRPIAAVWTGDKRMHLSLWALLLLQAAAIGVLLLQSCSLNIPFLAMLTYCQAIESEAPAEIASLEAERDQLLAEIAEKKTACVAQDTLGPGMDAVRVAGCWQNDVGVKVGERPVAIKYCFDRTGTTGRLSVTGDNGYSCRGDMKVQRGDDQLRFEYEQLKCSPEGHVSAGFWVCRAAGNGQNVCEGSNLLPDGTVNPDLRVPEARFYRTSESDQ